MWIYWWFSSLYALMYCSQASLGDWPWEDTDQSNFVVSWRVAQQGKGQADQGAIQTALW
jgi:hypothetical protein